MVATWALQLRQLSAWRAIVCGLVVVVVIVGIVVLLVGCP